jgi:hypothetical protein
MREYSFEQIWPSTSDMMCDLRESLEDAILFANDLDDRISGMARCPILWAGHVRARLAHSLPISLASDDFSLDIGFNLSLTINGRDFSFRILKAQEGELPSAKGSPGRRLYFNQIRVEQFEFDFDGDAEVLSPVAPNFVVVWSVGKNRCLCSLSLAYPKPMAEYAFGEEEPEQEWYWVEDLLEMTSGLDMNHDSGEFIDIDDIELNADDREIEGENDFEDGTGNK